MSLSDLSDSSASSGGFPRRGGAVEYVLADLIALIRTGVVAVGERLPSEAGLAARYGVSRTVVREVLRVTEARGLTLTQTGRGTFVTGTRALGVRFDGIRVAQLLEARPHIEVPAATLAAVRRTEAQAEALQQLLEAMEATADARRWVALDAELHGAIAEASGNPVFETVMRTLRAALEGQSDHLNRVPARRRMAESEHRRIVSAIARGSALEAEDAMQFHLDQVKDAYMSVVQSHAGSSDAPPDPKDE